MSRTNHRRTDRPATLAARCVFLPLSSYIDAPRALSTEIFGWTHRPDEMAVVPWAGHPAQVIGSAVKEVECVEIVDLVVQDAADWVVSGLLVDGTSRYARPDLVEAFASRLRQSAEAHGPIRVQRRGQAGLAGVVYAGQRASAKFYGCALGRVVDTRGSASPFAECSSGTRAASSTATTPAQEKARGERLR